MEGTEILESEHRYNLNRGYQKLRVWQDAITLNTIIIETCKDSSNAPSLPSIQGTQKGIREGKN